MEFYHIRTEATIDAQKELASAIINTFEYEPNQEISKQMADIRMSKSSYLHSIEQKVFAIPLRKTNR